MIDLSAESVIKHQYVHDLNGLTTITFKNDSDVLLGEIVIETVRYKKFMAVLANIAKEQIPDSTPIQIGPRTRFDSNSLIATSEY